MMIKAIEHTRKPHRCDTCRKEISAGSQAWHAQHFYVTKARDAAAWAGIDPNEVPADEPPILVSTRHYYHRGCARPQAPKVDFKDAKVEATA